MSGGVESSNVSPVMTDSVPPTRGWFTGVSNIVRFNPGFYVAGFAVSLCGWVTLHLLNDQLPSAIWTIACLGVGLATWWLLASLVASWWVYDLSPLYRWDWLAKRAGCARIVFGHAGFDEVTWSLRSRFPGSDIVPVDFHDPVRMTEPSIRRARRLCPPLPGTISAGLDRWPLSHESLILFPLSAHEWRLPAERRSLLRAASGSLDAGGRIIVIEHLRDWRNFLVFGPGFMHFHSEQTWIRDAEAVGLRCDERFRVALFLRGWVFVLPGSQDFK